MSQLWRALENHHRFGIAINLHIYSPAGTWGESGAMSEGLPASRGATAPNLYWSQWHRASAVLGIAGERGLGWRDHEADLAQGFLAMTAQGETKEDSPYYGWVSRRRRYFAEDPPGMAAAWHGESRTLRHPACRAKWPFCAPDCTGAAQKMAKLGESVGNISNIYAYIYIYIGQS